MRLTLIMINICTAMSSILTSLLWYCSNCTIYGFCKAVWFFFTCEKETYNEDCRPSPYLLYEVKDSGETYMYAGMVAETIQISSGNVKVYYYL